MSPRVAFERIAQAGYMYDTNTIAPECRMPTIFESVHGVHVPTFVRHLLPDEVQLQLATVLYQSRHTQFQLPGSRPTGCTIRMYCQQCKSAGQVTCIEASLDRIFWAS
jgi:hypothetical protein